MNNLVIPPSPNWYETAIMTCAPDNTLIYGARHDLVVLKSTSDESQPVDLHLISKAHSQKIISVNINRNWGNPSKLAVTVSEDKVVKLWDMETLKKKQSHREHGDHERVVGATFAGDDRIISVEQNGTIIVWNFNLNSFNIIKDIFGFKVTITCISTCPHASWLTAFGLKNGLVLVTDLRKNGRLLYKLRGHDKTVLSLVWCPAPVNIFPSKPNNTVTTKKPKEELQKITKDELNSTSTSLDDTNTSRTVEKVEDKHEVENLENKSKPDEDKVKTKKPNPWINLKHADDDEIPQEQSDSNRELPTVFDNDFLAECMNLKKKILGAESPAKSAGPDLETPKKCADPVERKILKPKTKAAEESEKNVSLISASSDETSSIEQVPEQSLDTKDDINDTKTVSEEIDKNDENNVVENLSQTKPATIVAEAEQPRKEFLLASSGKDSHIYIWRAGTDGRMQTFLIVPNKNRKQGKSYDKLWITLCWVSPHALLSSSRTGELLEWTLPKPKDKDHPFRLIHNDHATNLFSIASPIEYLTEYNWTLKKELNAWTVGQDRLLLNTSLETSRTNLDCYPTIGGHITCFASSPLDPNRIAFGTGEGIIKVWDLSRPHTRNIIQTRFYQKIQTKVTTLAWHPSKEVCLAFGTGEGRIGMMDTTNTSRAPTLLNHFFRTAVHKIEWGPNKGNQDEMILYGISEGMLMTFDTNNDSKEPWPVETPDNTYAYNFAWKPDYSLMLLSSKSGSLIVYSNDLQIMKTYYLTEKLISIIWHPNATDDNIEVSPYCNTFAAISKTKSVVNIYELNIDKESVEESVKIVDTLEGHEDLVNSCAWCPFDNNKIVTVGDDGLAQVRDIKTKAMISEYWNPNFDGLSAVIWSPADSDYVIVGAKDFTITIFKISEYMEVDHKALLETRKKRMKALRTEIKDKLPKGIADDQKIVKENQVEKKPKTYILPVFHKKPASYGTEIRSVLDWKENNACSINQKDGDKFEFNILHIFGDHSQITPLINESIKRHKMSGKHALASMLSLWNGDIATSVKEAIEQRRVTPLTLSLAPMVSPKLWQDACAVYAEQLTQEPDSDPNECVTYFLACHKVKEAIDVLCNNSMMKEALTLAKARMPDDQATITDILEKWARHAMITGEFEVSAECYISLGKYEDAASVLFRRTDLDILELAMELAQKSENPELYKAIMFRYNAFKENKEKSTKNEGQNAHKDETNGTEDVNELIVQKKDSEEEITQKVVVKNETNEGDIMNLQEDIRESTSEDDKIAINVKIALENEKTDGVTNQDSFVTDKSSLPMGEIDEKTIEE